MSRLRAFQAAVKQECYGAFSSGAKVVMPVLPTGSGKTVIVADMAHEYSGFGCAIAHRSELVGQISVALAREDLRHDIIAPKGVIRTIVAAQMEECGRSFYDPRAKWKVASVDTLLRRELDANWFRQVGLVFQDEGHHVLRENKWGRALTLFPNAVALLPTATPERADGKGLGRGSDGLVDALVEGPGMRWMIDNGYLCDYRILAPTTADLSMAGVEISAVTGDYNVEQTRKRVKASTTIIGDVVGTYLQHCKGLRGITFAVDVEHATQIAAAFNAAGVPARVVHAETPEADRRRWMAQLKSGELLQLVNVDLFGEGVDVPAVQVVSMARPTMSYGLFVQQFGRALRLFVHQMLLNTWDAYSVSQRLAHIAQSPKPHAWIIDHVGNIVTHRGPPDWRTKPWTLEPRQKRTRAVDGIPLRACANPVCLQPFERIYPACPYCGWTPPVPATPTRPAEVDGDMVLYTREMLEELIGRAQAATSDFAPIPVHIDRNSYAAAGIRNAHARTKEAQEQLRRVLQLMMPPTLDERIAQRRFFHTFGVDTLTAQGLGSTEATALTQRILERLTR